MLCAKMAYRKNSKRKGVNKMIYKQGKRRQMKAKKMTDREYAQYLLDWLRFDSSEDVCAKCANCPKDDFCPNADQNSVDFDYNTCFYGMKQYAEEHRTDKK